MVGIVLVSHSYELATGLKKMLEQIQPNVPVAVGAGDDEGQIGTNLIRIKEAIESVYSEDGVLVLFDLGSALFSTELAIEELGADKKVQIADAPLVEGAYMAVVQAGCNSPLEEVRQMAEQAKELVKIPVDE
jgi:PTS hybrid protein